MAASSSLYSFAPVVFYDFMQVGDTPAIVSIRRQSRVRFYDFVQVGHIPEIVSDFTQEIVLRPSGKNVASSSSLDLDLSFKLNSFMAEQCVENTATNSLQELHIEPSRIVDDRSLMLMGSSSDSCLEEGENKIRTVGVKRKYNDETPKRRYARQKTQGTTEEMKKTKHSEVISSNDFKIAKKLEKADVDANSRLLIRKEHVSNYINPYLSDEQKKQVESEDGMEVTLRDVNTGNEYIMRFKSNGKRKIGTEEKNSFYVLMNGWRDFVRRRALRIGDAVGLNFDARNSRFDFDVIKREEEHNWAIVPADFWKSRMIV